jgi:hypothetical protein
MVENYQQSHAADGSLCMHGTVPSGTIENSPVRSSARFYALKDKCWEKSKEKPLSSLPKARAQQRGARNSIQLSKNFLLAVYQPETLNPTHAAQAHPGGPFDH